MTAWPKTCQPRHGLKGCFSLEAAATLASARRTDLGRVESTASGGDRPLADTRLSETRVTRTTGSVRHPAASQEILESLGGLASTSTVVREKWRWSRRIMCNTNYISSVGFRMFEICITEKSRMKG
jgi:hypothetical protein